MHLSGMNSEQWKDKDSMGEKLFCKIIEDYIVAYNSFDTEKMLADMHDDIHFENITGGVVSLTVDGKEELRKQAEQGKKLFEERRQKITGIKFDKDTAEADIVFDAKVAMDFPNGIKKGDRFELKGKSVFRFKENKIIELKDIS